MRLALFTDGIWPYVTGGMQRHSFYLCKYLAQNGVDVDLFHFNQGNYDITKLEFFSEEERKRIRSIVVPFPKSVRFPGHYLYNSYRYSKQLAGLIAKDIAHYDFVYCKGFTAWYLLKHRPSKLHCPVGVNFHGLEMFQEPPDLRSGLQQIFLFRRPARTICRRADVVFSYGGKITSLIESMGIQRARIYEMPSGVEAGSIAPSPHSGVSLLKFLFIGRYERRKGIEELNTAILRLQHDKKRMPASFIS
jgi:glycosyltransferase involved in cell wall biosynthesis